MPIFGAKLGVLTTFVARIAHDENKGFVFLVFFTGEAITMPLAFIIARNSRLCSNRTPECKRDITQSSTMLTLEGKATVADRSSTLRYDATMGRGEKVRR